MDPRFDGHTHGPWCPHGSPQPLDDYLEHAIGAGFRRYAVTEHLPLPVGFVDPMGPRECAMLPAELPRYLAETQAARERFAGRIEVLVGLEIDYLGAAQGGWHAQVLELLGPVTSQLDPEATLLSLHFLDHQVLDGTPAMQQALLPAGASIDALHLRYYATLKSAICASWRWRGRDLRPRRLGHLTLPGKFQRLLPPRDPERILAAAREVLELVAAEGMELDFNTAGLDKPDCGQVYLPEPLLSYAVKLGIPLVFGSDAHAPREAGRHLERAVTMVEEARLARR
ncbi:MAG: histidinol-phosphatase HisJ [Armatimonadetes bacterium]|nr:histidinol-phosphatase HisJ [Armatimonadota bacterium]